MDISSVSSIPEEAELEQPVEEDVWASAAATDSGNTAVHLRSWTKFYNRPFLETRNAYFSELGPHIYDSALVAQSDISGQIIQSKTILNSLLYLGLGRGSILYQYRGESKSFYLRIDDCRMSGYSLESFHSLSTAFVQQGNNMKHLHAFISKVQAQEQHSATLVAVAWEISAVLSEIETHIVAAAKNVHSLLQLQALFEGPGKTLECFMNLVASTKQVRQEEELLSRVFDAAREAEYEPSWIQETLFQVLVTASKPWLAKINCWLGFRQAHPANSHYKIPAASREFRDAEKGKGSSTSLEHAYQFESSDKPAFLSDEDTQLIVETGRALQLVRAHQPQHPLVRCPQPSMITLSGLEWQSSWHDIERIADQAKSYERNLQKAIEDFQNQGGTRSIVEAETTDEFIATESSGYPMSKQSIDWNIQQSIAVIEGLLPTTSAETSFSSRTDSRQSNADAVPDAIMLAPPVSLRSSLSFRPLIATQARLVNQACLRLLFGHHDIRAHFSVLFRYNLLGDGVFASRLSHALLDPNLESAESHKGHYRLGTSGLKLGYRESWPPASSELRLALMGILTDNYFPIGCSQRTSLYRDEMPGGLSFAIRDMSEEELQRCIDPNSIYALDFLRLQYQAPPPVDSIVTQSSLLKYDAVFKLLLRAKRMHFVVDQLSRDTTARKNIHGLRESVSLRLRVESHHFVSAVCTYFYEGVEANWIDLERRLQYIEKVLDHQSDLDHQCDMNHDSVSKLRDFHEQLLDRLMFTLLLRKRQAEVMKLLEEIFGLILRFAGEVRTASQTSTEAGLTELYEIFRKKVNVFIKVCRGLSERRGQGGTKGTGHIEELWRQDDLNEDGHNRIGQLLLKFEMNDFYARYPNV